MNEPAVALDASPTGWVDAAGIERAPLGEAADASYTSWRALGAPSGREAIVLGCAAAPIPGWVEDMRLPIEARGVALAGATAERIAGAPLDARVEAGRLVLRVAGGSPEPVGAARTELGFTSDGRVVTCFAVCASRDRRAAPSCDPLVASVRFLAGASPPPPGLVLRAITWAVHHPGPTSWIGAALFVGAAALAVATRRRPRARI